MSHDITLTVNGRTVKAAVEPRLHLADLLRGELGLTGTHLGCEQGVCGACTVVIDGKPQRSCIAFAVACDGAEIRTIEGLQNDPVMAELREAFREHHGLQCGFCTPGMLIAARDIVMRRGAADEATIREELSGNLCRCTGYMGIVAAVGAVAARRAPQVQTATNAVTSSPSATTAATPDTQPSDAGVLGRAWSALTKPFR